MSTTPSCSPSSSPRKRKLSDAGLDTEIPNEIIAEIDNESRIDLLGDDIKEQATKLRARAVRAVENPKIDHDDLRDSWKTLLMLIDSRTKASAVAKAHKAEVAALRSQVQEYFFLSQIGDWCHGFQNIFKKYEGRFKGEWTKALKITLQEQGLSASVAAKVSESYKDFFATRPYRVTKTLDLLRPEIENLKNCCGRRDTMFHNACPQLEDYFDDSRNVKWDEVWAACQKRKGIAQQQFVQGRIDEVQLAKIKQVINFWFGVHVSGWNEDGSAILHDDIKSLVSDIKSSSPKDPDKIPDSPYEEGKWDDLM
ncbi:unnamed protein product [Fusarium graminearum]|nr:unnamed protein product [Fusarium graminearum]